MIVPVGSTINSTYGGKRVGSLDEGDPGPSPMVLCGDNPGLLGARLPILNSLPSFFPLHPSARPEQLPVLLQLKMLSPQQLGQCRCTVGRLP